MLFLYLTLKKSLIHINVCICARSCSCEKGEKNTGHKETKQDEEQGAQGTLLVGTVYFKCVQ